jgi:hypothetical protein
MAGTALEVAQQQRVARSTSGIHRSPSIVPPGPRHLRVQLTRGKGGSGTQKEAPKDQRVTCPAGKRCRSIVRPQSHPLATLKPASSHLLGSSEPPTCNPHATLMRHQSQLRGEGKASLRKMRHSRTVITPRPFLDVVADSRYFWHTLLLRLAPTLADEPPFDTQDCT